MNWQPGDPDYVHWQRLAEDYRRRLATQLADVAMPRDADHRSLLRTMAHRWKGNAASFGLPELGAAAAELEAILATDAPSAVVLARAIDRLRQQVLTALRAPPSGSA